MSNHMKQKQILPVRELQTREIIIYMYVCMYVCICYDVHLYFTLYWYFVSSTFTTKKN